MKILIIPSATLVSKEMYQKVGKIPTIICPLKGRTMLDYLVEQYMSQVDQIIIVGFKKIELIRDFVKYRNYNIGVVKLNELHDLGYTIWWGLQFAIHHFDNIDSVYINFADTIVENVFDTRNKDVVFYSDEYTGDQWTYFQNDDDGKITAIYDKQDLEISMAHNLKLFIGVAVVSDIKALYTELLKFQQDENSDSDSFYKALSQYSCNHSLKYEMPDKWLDVGHTENYFNAKTGVAARVFNTIEIDEKRGILKKTSENKEKLINEIKWYLKIPDKLQYLLPRVYNYSLDFEKPYIEMEYYGYNTLHELMIWSDLTLKQWEKYFNKLNFIINDMQKYKYFGDKDQLVNSIRAVYIDKTVARLKQLEKNPEFSVFFEQPIIINGIKFYTLNEYLKQIPSLVENILIKSWTPEFTIIHGDLCFSNILIESNYGFMRIIDPRGEFGEFDIYGDPRYEMAKLLHSIDGKYDFIIEDMFNINKHGNEISFSIMEKGTDILNVFNDVFQKQLQNRLDIKLIEATLFLGMIPLHSDYPSRQLAMLATGIQLFDTVQKEWNNHDGKYI